MTHEPEHAGWMSLAIELAREGVGAGQSPFGAVIVRAGRPIATAHNEVWRTTDPTAHAEVVAIRRACAHERTIDLSGATMYTTCEPCPMCAAAIHWARLDAVCFGAGIDDARRAGFNELTVPIGRLYAEGCSPVRLLPRVMQGECANLFELWQHSPLSRPY